MRFMDSEVWTRSRTSCCCCFHLNHPRHRFYPERREPNRSPRVRVLVCCGTCRRNTAFPRIPWVQTFKPADRPGGKRKRELRPDDALRKPFASGGFVLWTRASFERSRKCLPQIHDEELKALHPNHTPEQRFPKWGVGSSGGHRCLVFKCPAKFGAS